MQRCCKGVRETLGGPPTAMYKLGEGRKIKRDIKKQPEKLSHVLWEISTNLNFNLHTDWKFYVQTMAER